MKILLILAIALMGLNMPIEAKGMDVKTWDRPCADKNLHNHDGFFRSMITPVCVEFGQDTTILTMEVRFRPGYWFMLPSDTHLMAEGKRYDLIGTEGIDLDSKTVCGQDGVRKFKLYFRPLPPGIEKFDFRETDTDDAGAFNIIGITDPAVTAKIVLPSTWRDNGSGEWLIGFFEEGVVYDSRFWNYLGDSRPAIGSSKFKITDGKEILPVKIGKLKNGARKISIGDAEIVCSMITGRTLPDYPLRDDRPGFIDNGYSKIDTAIVRGWLKDSPVRIETYSVSVDDPITGNSNDLVCKVDSLGRFELKIPMLNTTECFMDWKNTFIRTVLEPDKTYYMLYDFGRGQTLFMGEDCRVQNELLAYPLQWVSVPKSILSGGGDKYVAAVDSVVNCQLKEIADLMVAHPGLSERFRYCQTGHILSLLASDLGQSRFSLPDRKLTDKQVKYMTGIIGNREFRPYTLHRDFFIFLTDLIGNHMHGIPDTDVLNTDNLIELSDDADFSDEEKSMLVDLKSMQNKYVELANSGRDSTWVVDQIAKLQAENASLIDSVNRLVNGSRMRYAIMSRRELLETVKEMEYIDSLGVDDALRSLWLAKKGLDVIDNARRPLTQTFVKYLKDQIDIPVVMDQVMAVNDRYVALERRTNGVDQVAMIRNIGVNDDVVDGKILLDSITAPHKGKIILMDIWGTWCGPCREALSKSQDEYAELAGYDIVYVYLANNSPEDSWRNIIEEYNVKGDNCFHFNLPDVQQSLIEGYLNINSYPSYRLFDREGNLLDVNADPRNIRALKNVLDKLR